MLIAKSISIYIYLIVIIIDHHDHHIPLGIKNQLVKQET